MLAQCCLNAGYVCFCPNPLEVHSSKKRGRGAGRWRDDVVPTLNQLQLHHGWPGQQSFTFFFYVLLWLTWVCQVLHEWLLSWRVQGYGPKLPGIYVWNIKHIDLKSIYLVLNIHHIRCWSTYLVPALYRWSSPSCSSSPLQTCSIQFHSWRSRFQFRSFYINNYS